MPPRPLHPPRTDASNTAAALWAQQQQQQQSSHAMMLREPVVNVLPRV